MYVKYYRLKGKPFGLNPDPKFFFNSSTHKRALAALASGMKQGQGFIVVTGDSGTGKTTLMSAMLHMLDQTDVITARINNTQLQSDEMLRYVAAELGLQYENCSKVSLLKSVETFLDTVRAKGQRILVLIDEAQNLSDSAVEELRMLMNLVKGNDPSIQFVLLGQTRFKESLYSDIFEPLRQRIVISHHLSPLNEEETKAYINLRLRTVGWLGKPEISPGAYLAVYDFSCGLPSKINLLCDKALQAACLNGHQLVTEADILSVTRELNNEFSDDQLPGSLVEDVIDAMMLERTTGNITENVIEKPAEPRMPSTQESIQEAVSSEQLEENIALTGLADETEEEIIPMISEQISTDQALVEAHVIPSEEIDNEIQQWLADQKVKPKDTKNSEPTFSPSIDESLLMEELEVHLEKES